jgi:hypothetical protein
VKKRTKYSGVLCRFHVVLCAVCRIKSDYSARRFAVYQNKTVQLIVLTDSGQTDNRQQQKKDRQRTEEAQQQHTDSARNVYATDRQKDATEGHTDIVRYS